MHVARSIPNRIEKLANMRTFIYTATDKGTKFDIELTEPDSGAEFLKHLTENQVALENAMKDSLTQWRYRRAAGHAKSKNCDGALDWFADILRERETSDGEPTKADVLQSFTMRKAWLDRYNTSPAEKREDAVEEIQRKFDAFCAGGGLKAPTWSPEMQQSEIATVCRNVRLAKIKLAGDVSSYL